MLVVLLLLVLLLPRRHSHNPDRGPHPASGSHFQHPLGVRVRGRDRCACREALMMTSAKKSALSANTAAAAVQRLLVGLLLEVFFERNTVAVGRAGVLRCHNHRQRRRRRLLLLPQLLVLRLAVKLSLLFQLFWLILPLVLLLLVQQLLLPQLKPVFLGVPDHGGTISTPSAVTTAAIAAVGVEVNLVFAISVLERLGLTLAPMFTPGLSVLIAAQQRPVSILKSNVGAPDIVRAVRLLILEDLLGLRLAEVVNVNGGARGAAGAAACSVTATTKDVGTSNVATVLVTVVSIASSHVGKERVRALRRQHHHRRRLLLLLLLLQLLLLLLLL